MGGNREFFKISPEKVVAALRISGATEIKTSNDAIDRDGNVVKRGPPTSSIKKRFDFS